MSLDAFHRALRETVTIIRPMYSVVPRGVPGVRKSDRFPSRSIRFRPEQLATIDEAARLLEMNRSQFMIWCALQVANDIIRQYKEFAARNDAPR